MMNIRDRYRNDSAFSRLVDLFLSLILEAQFTPTEIREAAMLAQIMYEERHPRPIIFTREDVIGGKV